MTEGIAYRATVLVATRNRFEQLALSLRTLLARNYPEDVQILVVDDASDDGTPELLRQYERQGFWWTRLDRQGGYRTNPSAVLNFGHALAKAPMVIEQGGEVCHLTDCVEPLVQACEPGVVALARVHNGTPEEMLQLSRQIEAGDYPFPQTIETDRFPTLRGGHIRIPVVEGVQLWCGAERLAPFLFCGAIHQADFEAVGRYDERRRGENDEDLARRLLKRGVRFRFVGRAVAFHLRHSKT